MTDQKPNKSESDPDTPRRPGASGDRKSPGSGGGGGGGGGAPTPPPGRASRGQFGWLLIAAVAMLLFVAFQTLGPPRKEITWKEFVAAYNEGSDQKPVITDIVLTTNAINATRQSVQDSQPTHVTVRVSPLTLETTKKNLQDLTGGAFKERGPSPWTELLSPGFLLLIGFFIFIWIMIARGLRGAGGAGGMLGNFGKSRHRVLAKEQTGVTFADVAGVDEAKEEVQEIVQFLKNPKRFMKLGGRIPRGVLLVGPPGCGKTLLAKAIAGEADVPFFTISGSDFVEMFVGVGASRVRDLFKQAKDSAPCIIFLDEIDAVGRRRGSGFSSGGHDEREQTLNAILVEMDGFDSSDQVIVIAATNRADVLDPALTRPGRFDRQVVVTLPDVQGRYEILKVHARKVRLGSDVDLLKVARGTPMFSGAELEAIINEAAIIATLADKDFVEQDDLEEARDKVRYGRSRKSRVIEEKERVATAYHEAGHAVVQMLMPEADPLHKVTIIPRGQAMGATFSLPEKDRYGYGLRWLRATMRVMCGGRIAEKIKTSDVSSGAAMDIQQVTELARHMVLEWGMSEKLGFVRYSGSDTRESFLPEREYSEETARIIDEEIRHLSAEAYTDAQKLIEDNWSKVELVAESLLRHETLSVEEVRRLMRGEALDKPTVSDLIEAESKRQSPARQARPRTDDDKGIDPGMLPSPA